MNTKPGLDILSLISPDVMARMKRSTEECHRIASLDDGDLAAEIVRLARQARALHPDELRRGDVYHDTYTTALFYDVIPEIGRRLGCVEVLDDEVRDEIAALSDEQLREWAVDTLARTSLAPRNPAEGGVDPWEVLRDEVGTGFNPVLAAMDRIRPVSRPSSAMRM
jgi:hypothetical protein